MIAQINNDYIRTRASKVYGRLLSYVIFEGRPLTTKGRWINPFIFMLFDFIKKLPQMKKVEQPIFILGTGRSGTTILGILLSIHKDVSFLNEPKALWHSIQPYEDLIGSYSNALAHYYLDSTDADEKQKQAAHKLYGANMRVTFNSRIVDKYPELIFRIPYVKQLFPDGKFLFLVRNGWDTCGSIKLWSERLGVHSNSETHDWWGRSNRKWKLLVEEVIKSDQYFEEVWPVIDEISAHTDMAALEWIATMRQGLRAMKKYPESILRVNYEELVLDPVKILHEIELFCNLENDSVLYDYGKKVMKPVVPKKQMSLHPTIEPLFNDTMETMGYL